MTPGAGGLRRTEGTEATAAGVAAAADEPAPAGAGGEDDANGAPPGTTPTATGPTALAAGAHGRTRGVLRGRRRRAAADPTVGGGGDADGTGSDPGGGDPAGGGGDADGTGAGSSTAAATAGPAREAWTLPDAVPPQGRRSTVLVVALLGILALPLVVALVVLHSPRWFPLLDLAQTELRVRDVGGGDTPLVGLAGRIQAYGQQGSHPGPLSFLSLWPIYKLFGTSSFALQVASVGLSVIAVAGSLAVAHRRGGTRLALGVAAVVAVLCHAYGTRVFVEPWNPYMPVMWWLLFLLAVWAVLCGDVALLPVAVFAGSFCMQTHVSYLGLVGGMAALVVAAAVAWAVPRRHDRAALRPLWRWGALALALGVVLWLPPVVDQLTNDPGNAAMIIESFREPSDDPIGLGAGGELVAVHLNPWRFLAGQLATTGSVLPALGLLAAWAGAVVAAWRLRHAALLRLHAVVGAALVLALVSASRIFGELWYYLALWAWGICALVLVATVWSYGALVASRQAGQAPAQASAPERAAGGRGRVAAVLADAGRTARVATGALVAVLVVWTAMFTVDAADAEEPAVAQGRLLARLAPDTVGSLAADTAGTGGRQGRYLVTWTDPVAIGATGFGLLLELERQGFDVGVPEVHGRGAVEHRVLDPADATAEVHLAVGGDIATSEDRPGAVRVAYADGRSAEERARYDALRRQVIDELEAAGHGDLVPAVDTALMAIAIDEDVDLATRERVTEMANLGQPGAVFVIPL